MRQTIVNLVEAVRSLRLSRTHQPAPNCVRIGTGASEFPEHLLALLEAFDAVEREGGASMDDPEIEGIKRGLDGVFRWIRLQGLSTDEPLDIMAEALGGKARKKPKSFPLLPTFSPSFTKRKTWKPRLSTAPKLDGSRSLETLAQHVEVAEGMREVALMMGAAAPVSMHDEAASRGMGPR